MSLATRCALVWTIFATTLVALSSWLNYRSGRVRLLESWDERLGHELEVVRVRTETGVANAARDAQTLAASPFVREYVRQRGKADAAFWREMMEEEFLAVVAGKPAYFQVRLIGLDDNGREVVRVDRTAEGVAPMPAERLQQKGGRDYFKEALAAEAGEVSLSELNLNRDFGKIDVPYIPTLRASVAVRDETGELFGMVVINVDLRGLLDALAQQAAPGVQLMLANARGDYLLHPDPARRFGGDLGTNFTFVQDDAAHQPVNALVREANFTLAPDSPRRVSARVVCPAEVWLTGLTETRNRTLLAALATAVASVPLVVWLARLPLGRLRRLTESVSRYEAGQKFTDSPGGTDEIGALAGKFGELTERVRESIEKIETARREAHDAAQARDDFLAMMSHEIRTPLNAVSGLVRVIERNRPAPHQQPILHSLRAAMRQLVALLNDALDWSKIRARKLTFEDAVFPLREVLSDAALTHEPLARQKELAFIVSIAEQVPERVHGDSARLTQVLNNLLGNALKFTEHGSLTLTAGYRDGALQLIVEDTGIGIDEAHIGRIFSPFDQAHGGIGRRFGGSGLGLSITRTLVEMQGGTLAVESRVGEGTRFTVTLPMPAAEGVAASDGTEAVEASSLRGKRVLYVEDTASNREVMAALIAETEATLVLAETVAEGMEKLRTEPCDAALVDLQLPDASGFDFARQALAMRPHLPIVAVTAQTDEETRDACIAVGMMDVVVKPVEPARLFATLAKCFGGTPPGGAARTALATLFRGEPERVARVARAMATEFLAARAPVENGDVEARRRVRHQLHSAVHQLNLEELRGQLDRLAAGENDADLISACVASLTKIAAELGGSLPA